MRPHILLCVGMLLLQPAAGASTAARREDTVSVMSFNVRFPSPNDGSNIWDKRKSLFIETIRRAHPDVIGTQEIFQSQADAVIKALPKYRWFGLDRFGAHTSEHMGIFYDPTRLCLLEHGQFWLSKTPDKPGSLGWGAPLPRSANWAIFAQGCDRNRAFLFMDTHLANRDIEDEQARVHSAELIVNMARRYAEKRPAILTADLNADPESQAHAVLATWFTDAWTAAANRSGPPKTFHDFTGIPTDRIDTIMLHGAIISSIKTDTFHKGRAYPSDHFPVEAVISFPMPTDTH